MFNFQIFNFQNMSNFTRALIKISVDLDLSFDNSGDQLEQLSFYLNELINRDFNAVVQILYRMDVSEAKVREKLANPLPSETAGSILAHLLIQREMEKMKWREQFKNGEL